MRPFLFALLALTIGAQAGERLSLAQALAEPKLRCTITGATPLTIAVENLSDAAVAVSQPAGLVCAATARDRIVTLRAVEIVVPPRRAAEAVVPCAALSPGSRTDALTFRPTPETEPRLTGLLDYFAGHNDVPRLTAQLLVWCVLEDFTFSQWQQSLGAAPTAEAAAQQVVAAIDALGVLREVAPQHTFALASDPELKLRALRNPVARGKAMQLYGIILPDAPLPPELGTLLHTKPGDNCPICRQRALMQPREDGL